MRKLPKLFLSSILFFAPAYAFAHVGYVISDIQTNAARGQDIEFLMSPLRNPLYIGLMVGTALIFVVAYFILCKTSFCRRRVDLLQNRAATYEPFLAWIARIAAGIMLIGAGINGELISPALHGFSYFSSFQILLGFCILSGFLLFPAVYLALLLFIFALSQHFYLIGNSDIPALLLSVILLADARPGIDDLFDISFLKLARAYRKAVPLIVRIGLGGAFMFLAIYEKFLNPHLSEFVVHQYRLTSIIPVSAEMWVLSAGIIEFLVGLCIFIGIETRFFTALAFMILTASFFYFGETVYSHITLFAALSMLFITGGGAWSVDKKIPHN